METPPNQLSTAFAPMRAGDGHELGAQRAVAALSAESGTGARPRNPALGLEGEALRKPAWLKVPLPGGEAHSRLKSTVRELGLHTVCEEARCPNIGECWKGEHATMTLMVLGDECTRRCRFCAVKTVQRAAPPDPEEPAKVGMAIASLNLGYVVITSVDRDDLPDGGSAHYAACIREVRARSPRTAIETLAPDYQGSDLATLMAARPDVFAHNVEVVARLQRKIRDPRCSFERSLATLRGAKALDPHVFTKSSLMVGLGETQAEIELSLRDLRAAEVDFLTVGQYLRPSPQHAPVHEYVTPERFFEIQKLGESLGFKYVASGPLVRSSYRAGEFFAARLIRERREAVRALANKNASQKNPS
jgi:lipoic acid synthetase